jgi:tetratricopeptide (TPR) repeat protein
VNLYLIRLRSASFRVSLGEIYHAEGRPVVADQTSPLNPNMPPEVANLEKSAREYAQQGLYVQAELSYRQVIDWIEQHPTTETRNPDQLRVVHHWLGLLPLEYNLLGRVVEMQGRSNDAEMLYKRAIETIEANADAKQPASLGGFNFSNLLNLYRKQNRLADMEPMLEHVLELQEKFFGENSTHLADTLLTFADVYQEEGEKEQSKNASAEPLYERALTIQEANLGPDNLQMLRALTGYLIVARNLGDDAKAAELQARISRIQKESQIPTRPN